MATRAGWGGRRRSHLTRQEEEEFLRPWREQAQSAGVRVLSPIRAALAQKLGQALKASVVWRLLARHGWRRFDRLTRGEFILMILNGASSHRARDLPGPAGRPLEPLPADAPELHPQEHPWDELREKEFPNRGFESLEAVVAQLHAGLARLSSNPAALQSIPAWPWIKSLNLNAT